MSKQIETDFKTFVKFWSVPLLIGVVILIAYKALTGLIIVGASIFLALALRPLVNKVNDFFVHNFGKDKKNPISQLQAEYINRSGSHSLRTDRHF